ncbi:MAG: glycosyltransferase family 4 protein [Solirubrobacteraceae bacterium]
MRVLAVGNMYPPHHLGGYELVWRSAMRSLRDHGYATRVLCSDVQLSGPAASEAEDAETYRELRWYWRDHAWPALSWRDRIALERGNAAVLERHLESFAPDVVSWWSMGGMSLSLMERVRRLRVPAVAFVADDWLLYAPKVDQWIRPLRRLGPLARLAQVATGIPARVNLDDVARYVLISETVRRAARGAGLALNGSTVAHLGVDDAFLDPRPERPWEWRLLYVGRIDERKGIEDAVRALVELPESASLTVVGDGDPSEAARLRSVIDALGLGQRVRFLGMRGHDELPLLYDDCNAVLFPVRWSEPWGIVPLEAMALGRPVVATGMGGSGEYLRDGVNCLLTPAADPSSLSDSVKRLAGDEGLRERLRAGGSRTARTHTESVFNAAVLAALGGAN